MKCRRAHQLLFDFVDGMSDEVLRAELDRHLGECAECERFADEMARSLALIHRAPAEALDESFNWKVRLGIHRARNQAGSRADASGAWARAWNFRYVLSAGVMFGLVLTVGAVVLREAVKSPATTGAEIARPTSSWESPPIVPRPGGLVGGGQELVSSGSNLGRQTGASHGAIDEATTDATIDSLVSADLLRMTPEQKSAYIQRRIVRLQLHLQGQGEPPTRP